MAINQELKAKIDKGLKDKKAKSAGLTRKQKDFADKILDNPKISNTQAYVEAYGNTNIKTAGKAAHSLMKNPKILQYMDSYAPQAERRIIELTQSENERIALDASRDILDRTKGKAIARTESMNVNVSIESFLNEEIIEGEAV